MSLRTLFFIHTFIALSVFFIACDSVSYHKTPSGVQYRFISRSTHAADLLSPKKAKEGDFFKVYINRFMGGVRNYQTQPSDYQYFPYQNVKYGNPKVRYQMADLLDVFREGDSVRVRIPMDSLFAYGSSKLDPYYRPAQYISFDVKVAAILTSEQKNADEKATWEAQIIAQQAQIARFIHANNYAYTERMGTFVAPIHTGTGALLEISDTVQIYYTAYFLDGKKFDGNMGVQGATPLPVVLGAHQVIPGLEYALLGAHEGDKLHIIIPSDLAYGRRGAADVIPPNTPLRFDVEVLNVRKGVKKTEAEKK